MNHEIAYIGLFILRGDWGWLWPPWPRPCV